ncbi:hypothetical protein [Streptomyces sp. NPDC051561]|uniref:hypothetical protein n=1 Tax=Streptomyces sp. NPDC051561 TaxID=3365658 RepID=UPI0037B05C95
MLLLALAALLVPVAAVSVWADREIDDTDAYVAQMAPLAENTEVRQAVATRLTTEIMKQIDLGPLQDGAGKLLADAAQSFTGTDAYRQAWNTVNRVTHDAFRDALAAPVGSGDAVTLDLAPVTEELKAQLQADNVPLAGRIPVVHTDITLARTDQLDTWRGVYKWLSPLAGWLPWVVLALVVAAVLVAGWGQGAGRWLFGLAGGGVAVVVGASLLALVLAVAHNLALSSLPADVSRAAAEAVYSTLTGPLRTAAWVLGGAGLVVAVGAGAARLLVRRRETRTLSDHPPRGAGRGDAGWSA